MSMWTDDFEAEADYDSEDYDSEDYDSEASRSDAQRRARARRIALARQRAAMQRRRGRNPVPAPSRPPTPRQTVAAIRNLDLENKVGEDSLKRALEQSNRRATRATYSAMAGVAVDQAFDSFATDFAGHDFVRAGLRWAPLLLLSPQRRRPGVEGYLSDPRVIGGATVAALVAAAEIRNRGSRIDDIQIAVPAIVVGQTGTLRAVAVDRNGKVLSETITFASQDDTILRVASSGAFDACDEGTALVTATADKFTKAVFVVVAA